MQKKFQRHLFQGDKDIFELITADHTTTVTQRLATYRNAYIARLVEALSTDYACLKALIGEEAFNALCSGYIKQYPSTYTSLRWFGMHFPAYIKQHSNSDQGRLYDLAIMESMFINAFDAAEQQTLNAMTMMSIPIEDWPGIRITFHPSVFYFSTDWNTIATWRALKNKQSAPAPEIVKNTTCLIWRQALNTRYRVLDADEAVLIEHAMQGTSFAQLCDTLTLLPVAGLMPADSIAMRAASLLKLWLDEGLVSRIN